MKYKLGNFMFSPLTEKINFRIIASRKYVY